MRFFAHDGKTTHGPSPIEDLLALPGFDGDTLVCPVGSADSADWKPALAYPAFKKALLAAETPPAPRAPAPPPAPDPKKPCPFCAEANLAAARFCNSCGKRMDGTVEPRPAPAPVPAPAPQPLAEPEHFSPFDPLRIPAEASAPVPPAPRPAGAGRMGRLAELEESGFGAPSLAPEPAPLAPLPAAPAAAGGAAWSKGPVLAAFLGAAAAAAGVGWLLLSKPSAPQSEPVAELTPSAPAPAPVLAAPEPPAPSPAPVMSTPPMTVKVLPKPKPASQPVAAVEAPKPRPRRARRPRPAPKPAPVEGAEDAVIIESRAGDRPAEGSDPLLESLLSEASKPAPGAAKPAADAAAAAAAEPKPFTLPGLQPRASALDRAPSRAPRNLPPAEPAKRAPAVGQAKPEEALGEPGAAPAAEEPAGPPEGAAEAAAAASEEERVALMQVHEQFGFCAQLLSQGAFGDHFDTCLCTETRAAAPYRGRRGFYASALKKDADAGRLQTTPKILASKLEGMDAKLSVLWKAGPGDKGTRLEETWKLEEGLWCRAP